MFHQENDCGWIARCFIKKMMMDGLQMSVRSLGPGIDNCKC